MLVGGMPQAINTYIETNNLSKVDETKRKIIKLYEDDLLKIDTSGRASKMFLSIPAALSRNAPKDFNSQVYESHTIGIFLSTLGIYSIPSHEKSILLQAKQNNKNVSVND